MKITTVLFDLDGTLLPMKQEGFMKAYFEGLARKLAPHGYEKDSLIASILAGTKAMVKNNGDKLNEEAFWDVFSALLGEKTRDDIVYSTSFTQTTSARYKPPADSTREPLML